MFTNLTNTFKVKYVNWKDVSKGKRNKFVFDKTFCKRLNCSLKIHQYILKRKDIWSKICKLKKMCQKAKLHFLIKGQMCTKKFLICKDDIFGKLCELKTCAKN